jgi:hypothetical protein
MTVHSHEKKDVPVVGEEKFKSIEFGQADIDGL